jgi:hypothetical protein
VGTDSDVVQEFLHAGFAAIIFVEPIGIGWLARAARGPYR